ncbi:hypothetical protein Dimus_034794 [Dionaea muscipula]
MALATIEIPSQNARCKSIVESLYKALAAGESTTVANLMASDLEGWFHSPPQCQHMMKVLTGEADWAEFVFEPRTITAIDGGTVIAEGWPEGAAVQGSYWVHVWTVSEEGLIVQFREYVNTWLTVRVVSPTKCGVDVAGLGNGHPHHHHVIGTLWQSQPCPNFTGRWPMPGLVLAI